MLGRLLTAHPGVRYVIAGTLTTLQYTGVTLLLSGPLGVPIQAAIPVAFALALVTHFLMQRVFVWRHIEAFALRGRHQLARYLAVGGTQYLITAAIVATVPHWIGAPEQVVYVVAVGSLSMITFLLLRGGVFHESA